MSKQTDTSTKTTLVPVFIPKRYPGDDVRTVSVNGHYKHIPTGKQFLIEPHFAEAVENALLADKAAEDFIASAVRD